jgi:hypothetical protein
MLQFSDPRQQRGLEIAATANIIRKGSAWLVPSQSRDGRYTVCPDPEAAHCTCPDHEPRGSSATTFLRLNTRGHQITQKGDVRRWLRRW